MKTQYFRLVEKHRRTRVSVTSVSDQMVQAVILICHLPEHYWERPCWERKLACWQLDQQDQRIAYEGFLRYMNKTEATEFRAAYSDYCNWIKKNDELQN